MYKLHIIAKSCEQERKGETEKDKQKDQQCQRIKI